MFILAMVCTVAALLVAFWLIESGGQPMDISGTLQAIRENHKLWQVVAVPLVLLIAWAIASTSASAGTADKEGGYLQYLNGALISADVNVTTCQRDGSCAYEYDCDPYTIHHPAQYDSDGNETSPAYDTTEYHSCPYVTKEYTYTTTGTFGFKTVVFTVVSHDFARSPQEWRSGHGIPSGVLRGPPTQWLKARADIAAGDSDPITGTDKYVNYILASNDSILKSYSSEVDLYLKRGLLPEHTAGVLKGRSIHDIWDADKMSFVGFKPEDAKLWEARLMRFNAALGMTKQGDLHIVAIKDSLVNSGQSENYANALKAYWQGPKMGKKALAKNSVMVVLGVNTATNTISWARAKTGMPVGNGSMNTSIETRLPGKSLVPGTILGKIKARVTKDDKGKLGVDYQHTNGVLERIMFNDFPFARACMMCKHANQKGQASFVYLEASIKQPAWAYWMDGLLSILLGAIAGGLLAGFGTGSLQRALAGPTY